MIQADFHLHSHFSQDSLAPMEEMIKKGLSLGLHTMCFTEHMDFDYVKTTETTPSFSLDTPSYYNCFLDLKKQYKGHICLLFGVELGLQPHILSACSAYAKQYPFDFIIASSHLANRRDPYYPQYFQGRREEEGYLDYFHSIFENISSFDDFQVYGHLDYVIRYGPYKNQFFSFEKYQDILEPILKSLIEKGKGIELNTSGFKYGLFQPHPQIDILKHYRELGGEIITIGSDGHKPEEIANHFSTAKEILIQCGFTYYTIFKNQHPEFLHL